MRAGRGAYLEGEEEEEREEDGAAPPHRRRARGGLRVGGGDGGGRHGRTDEPTRSGVVGWGTGDSGSRSRSRYTRASTAIAPAGVGPWMAFANILLRSGHGINASGFAGLVSRPPWSLSTSWSRSPPSWSRCWSRYRSPRRACAVPVAVVKLLVAASLLLPLSGRRRWENEGGQKCTMCRRREDGGVHLQ